MMNYVVSLQAKNSNDLWKDMQQFPFVEIRLDITQLSYQELVETFQNKATKTIVTCRENENNMLIRSAYLVTALQYGADYVDIEIEADNQYKKMLFEVAKYYGRKVILSYHNYELTPSLKELQQIEKEMLEWKPDILKIITTVNQLSDCEVLQKFYQTAFSPQQLIAFGMGEVGKLTRVDCLKSGCPFTYVAARQGEETAPGQWNVENFPSINKTCISGNKTTSV